ncbi:hypothetical protein CMUS01_03035 [Colletotrichum musicola]|uniref:Chromo domain-containing protein n=1 Tax=Colletotrichum musicola TaxID=2175873 RepID=A0A8H6NTY5_9PEZI|nr:hypothetical protein CMUS01_03035 [Colletotrichum musicola]
MTLEELTNGPDNHVLRLKNSALQERHVTPSWQYAGPHVCDDRFLEVDFAPEAKRQRSKSRDYLFTCIYPQEQHSTSGTSVHADLTSVAKRYGARVNEIHSFMRFPPVRAVVRTLLIELESPKAQPGRRPDEVALVLLVNDILSETTPLQRQRFLTQTTVPGPDFAGRALVMCLVKLYAQFESWNFWHWGSGERRSVLEVLVSVIGLFCNAWINAPEIDASWARLGSNITSPISLHEVGKVEKSQPSHLTPEVWLEWSLMYDPWIRRADSLQLLTLDNTEIPKGPTYIPPPSVAEVSEPEADNEGRVTVSYLNKPDEERWAFRAILDSRWSGKSPRTGLQYLVDWEYAEPSWQPARDLQGCDQWVLQFHRSRPDKPGPVPKLRRLLSGAS